MKQVLNKIAFSREGCLETKQGGGAHTQHYTTEKFISIFKKIRKIGKKANLSTHCNIDHVSAFQQFFKLLKLKIRTAAELHIMNP